MGNHRYGLSIGCTYIQRGITNITLHGTYNDASNMNHLMETYGYEIVFMNDVDYISSNELYPTMQNILKQLQIILNKANTNDDVFIYYAGHGVQFLKNILISDVANHDIKTSGIDEAIVPVNFGFKRSTGFINVISDNTLNQFIRDFGKSKVKILLIFDCCHCGTVCNLKYSYGYVDANSNGIVYDIATDQHIDKIKPIRSDVISVSACIYNELNYEDVIRFAKSENGKEQGVLTGSLRYALRSNPNITSDVFNILKAIVTYTAKYGQCPKISSNIPLHLNISHRSILDAAETISTFNIEDPFDHLNKSTQEQKNPVELVNSISLFGSNVNSITQLTNNAQLGNIKNSRQIQSIYNNISIKTNNLTKFLV